MTKDSGLVATYHRAPNFSINPPDAGGVLQLGSIIASISTAEEPLNEDCHIAISEDRIQRSWQKGFTATRSQMQSGKYGVFAKFIGIDGLGSELSWGLGWHEKDVYDIQRIDTITFNPTPDYIKESMNRRDVDDLITSIFCRPVFMVTGLKIARGPSCKLSRGTKSTGAMELGLTQPAGLPFEVGPKMDFSKENKMKMGFNESSDFICGIRVKKLIFKRHLIDWIERTRGTAVGREYNRGATMYDGDTGGDLLEDVDLDGEENGETGTMTGTEVTEEDQGILETLWVLG